MTGECGDNYGYEQLMVKWFRQVLPTGSQIDLLIKEIRIYFNCYACAPGQIFDW